MDDGTEFGAYVARAREQLNWSRAELLRKVGEQGVYLHATALKRIESGDQVVKIHEAAAICRAFGVPVDSWSTSNRARAQLYVDGRLRDMRAVVTALDSWADGKLAHPPAHAAGESVEDLGEVFRRVNDLGAVSVQQLVDEWEKRREEREHADADAPDWWKWMEEAPDGTA